MKKNAIYFLTGFAIVLVLLNAIVTKVNEPAKEELKIEDYCSEVDSLFFLSLEPFALNANWVQLKTLKKNKFDSIKYYYSIQVPADLPIPIIVKQVFLNFQNRNSTITSEERKNHQKSFISIESNNHIKLIAEFEKNNSLIRKTLSIQFLIDCSNGLSDELLDSISELLIPVNLMLIPSKNLDGIFEKIEGLGFSYSILLTDKAEDKEFNLSGVIDKTKIERVIKNLSAKFKDAKYFVVDRNSSIYNSSVYNFVLAEFAKKGISLVTQKSFINLETKDTDDAISLFNFHTAQVDSTYSKEIMVSPNIIVKLSSQIKLAKMKGVKFTQ